MTNSVLLRLGRVCREAIKAVNPKAQMLEEMASDTLTSPAKTGKKSNEKTAHTKKRTVVLPHSITTFYETSPHAKARSKVWNDRGEDSGRNRAARARSRSPELHDGTFQSVRVRDAPSIGTSRDALHGLAEQMVDARGGLQGEDAAVMAVRMYLKQLGFPQVDDIEEN
jgi:hypothetical protein